MEYKYVVQFCELRNFIRSTLILKLELDIAKTHVFTEKEVPSFNGSKAIAWTDTQTQTQTDSTEIITFLHTRMVIITLSEEYSHNDQNYRSMVIDMRKIRFLFADSTLLAWRAIYIAVVDPIFRNSLVFFLQTTQHTKTWEW